MWLSALALISCRSPGEAAWRVEVVSVAATTESAAPDDAWVRRAIAGAMGRTPLFEPGEGGDALALEVEFWEVRRRGDPGVRDLVVDLSLEAPAKVRAAGKETTLQATVLLERSGASSGAREADLEIAFSRAVSVLDARSRLALGTVEQVATLLAAPDPELALLALAWVRENGDRRGSFVDLVLARLSDSDSRVVLAAVHALGRIGAPEHAELLIAHIRASDAELAQGAYRALARLGGESAVGYLRFAAANEDEPERRRAAALALGSLGSQTDRALERSALAPRPRSHRR